MRETINTGKPSKAFITQAVEAYRTQLAGLAKGRARIKAEADARAAIVYNFALKDLEAGGSYRGLAGRIHRRMKRVLGEDKTPSESRIRKIYLSTRNSMPISQAYPPKHLTGGTTNGL